MSQADDIRAGRRLRWCVTHGEPAWLYSDDGISCMYDLVVEARTDHELTDLPAAAAARPPDEQDPGAITDEMVGRAVRSFDESPWHPDVRTVRRAVAAALSSAGSPEPPAPIDTRPPCSEPGCLVRGTHVDHRYQDGWGREKTPVRPRRICEERHGEYIGHPGPLIEGAPDA